MSHLSRERKAVFREEVLEAKWLGHELSSFKKVPHKRTKSWGVQYSASCLRCDYSTTVTYFIPNKDFVVCAHHPDNGCYSEEE